MTPSPRNIVERYDIWRSLWQFVASDRLLATTALGLTALLVSSTVLPQIPHDDSVEYARWLSDVQSRFGGFVDFLRALGLFDVVHSIIFRALSTILGVNFIVRLIDDVTTLRATRRPDDLPPPAASSVSTQHSSDLITRRLRGYRVQSHASAISADRFPWANLGSIAAHAGPLMVLIGLMLSPTIDWRVEALDAPPGTSSPVANTPYILNVSTISTQGEVNFALLRDGQTVVQGIVSQSQPVGASGISVYVQQLLPALQVSGQNQDGQPLDLQIRAESALAQELLLTFDTNRPDPSFAAPDVQFFVRLAPTGQNSYHVSVISIPDGSVILEQDFFVLPEARLDVNGNVFQFKQSSDAVLSVVYAPSQTLIGIGLIMAIAGILSNALYPARRIWIVTGEEDTQIICADPDFDLEGLAAESES